MGTSAPPTVHTIIPQLQDIRLSCDNVDLYLSFSDSELSCQLTRTYALLVMPTTLYARLTCIVP